MMKEPDDRYADVSSDDDLQFLGELNATSGSGQDVNGSESNNPNASGSSSGSSPSSGKGLSNARHGPKSRKQPAKRSAAPKKGPSPKRLSATSATFAPEEWNERWSSIKSFEVEEMIASEDPLLTFSPPDGKLDPKKYESVEFIVYEGWRTTFMRCKNCHKVLKKSSGSSLSSHVCPKAADQEQGDQPPANRMFTQAKKLTAKNKKKVRKAFADLMLTLGISFRKSAHPGFQNLISLVSKVTHQIGHVIDTDGLLPGRMTIARMSKSGFLANKQQLIELMRSDSVKSVSVTCDHWSDFAMKHHYLGVTGQFILLDGPHAGKIVHVLLALKEASGSSGSHLFNDYMEVISEYGIEQKINFVVTDGASHNKTAFGLKENHYRLYQALHEIHDEHFENQEEFADFFDKELADDVSGDADEDPTILAPTPVIGSKTGRIWVYCAAHLLQAATRYGFKYGASKTLKDLMTDCRKLVSGLRRKLAVQLLGITLNMPIDIRWDSRIMMIDSLIKHKDALIKLIPTLEKSTGNITRDEKNQQLVDLIRGITTPASMELLRCFKLLLEKLREYRLEVSGDSFPTLPLVVAMKRKLMKFLSEFTKAPDTHKDVKGFAVSLEKRLNTTFDLNEWHAAAVLLSPSYYHVRAKSVLSYKEKPEDEKNMYERGMDLISELYNKYKGRETSINIADEEDDGLGDLGITVSSQDKTDEVSNYFGMCGGVKKADAAKWFSEKYKLCPVMVEIAVCFMGPATSVKAESIFSTAGHRLGKRNQRMDPSTLEALLWRLANHRLFEEKIITDDADWEDCDETASVAEGQNTATP